MLEIVAFLCGAAVMVLEMAGARLLAPHLGTSIVVWTGLIGVILASLSAGYWLGGRLSDKNPRPALLGGIIFVAACIVALVGLLHGALLEMITASGMRLHAASVVAACVLFCPPGVLLGMVSPYIIRVKIALSGVDAAHSGAVIGRFFALSTVGSILGTFLGGYVLISVLGTRLILFSVSGALLISALLVLFMPQGRPGGQGGKKARGKRGVVVACGILFCAFCAAGSLWLERQAMARGLVEVDTRYNHIQVQERGRGENAWRYMITDPGKFQSAVRLDDPDSLAANYTRFFALTSLYQPTPERVLMLGGGGYTVPRRLLFEADRRVDGRLSQVDVVEIDPGMTAVAEKYFFLREDPRLRIFHEDARTFLNHRAKELGQGGGAKYDVVLLDTFNSQYAIPFHMCTVESMSAVSAVLSDTGVVAMNIIGAINGDEGRLFRSIYASVSQVFPEVRVFTVHAKNPDLVQNILLIASKGKPVTPYHPLISWEYTADVPKDMAALTDDFAPVERYALYD